MNCDDEPRYAHRDTHLEGVNHEFKTVEECKWVSLPIGEMIEADQSPFDTYIWYFLQHPESDEIELLGIFSYEEIKHLKQPSRKNSYYLNEETGKWIEGKGCYWGFTWLAKYCKC